mgnify:CR=1 FL=1|jgi:hypothetical protein
MVGRRCGPGATSTLSPASALYVSLRVLSAAPPQVYGCLEWLRPEHVFCVHPGSVTIHVPAPHDVAMDSSYHGGGGFASGKSAPSVLGSPCSKQQHHENPTSARLTAVTDILRRSGVPMNPHALAEQALAEGSITFSGMGTAGDSMKAFLNKVIRDGRCRSLVNLGAAFPRCALRRSAGTCLAVACLPALRGC